MIAPVNRLKKDEIVWLSNNRCIHRHTFLEHYQCYQKEWYKKERIGFIDIETSELTADAGILLSYCIKESGTNKILKGVIDKKDLFKTSDGHEDRKLVQQCILDMLKFDRLVGYYSSRFDISFLRTRALTNKLDFPEFKQLKHTDVWMMARSKLKLRRNTQENVCRNLFGTTEKTHVEMKYWRAALRGDKRSLNYILDHNIKDVKDLEKIYNKMVGFVNKTNTSI